jgi:hypothetical protein
VDFVASQVGTFTEVERKVQQRDALLPPLPKLPFEPTALTWLVTKISSSKRKQDSLVLQWSSTFRLGSSVEMNTTFVA